MRKHGSICSALAVLVFFLVGAGCSKLGGGGEEKPSDAASRPPGETRFDPLELPQDKQIVPKEFPRTDDIGQRGVDADAGELHRREFEEGITRDPEQVDTLNSQAYRIQLFTSKLFGEAQHARIVAEEIFDQPVYLDYEVPYFKVRVGSFAGRDSAEEYQQRAKTAGYGNAWVVMVNVGVQELPPLYDTTHSQPADTLHNGSSPSDDE